MPFLLHANLKADLWSKHKSFLAGSTGVGDKLKVLESAAAKATETDAVGLKALDAAIAGLMAVAVPAQQKAKGSKTTPAATTKYLQDMIAKATELRKLVAEKAEALGESNESEGEQKTPAPTRGNVPPAPPKATSTPSANRPLPPVPQGKVPPSPPKPGNKPNKEEESNESQGEQKTPAPTRANVPPPPPKATNTPSANRPLPPVPQAKVPPSPPKPGNKPNREEESNESQGEQKTPPRPTAPAPQPPKATNTPSPNRPTTPAPTRANVPPSPPRPGASAPNAPKPTTTPGNKSNKAEVETNEKESEGKNPRPGFRK